MAPITDRFKAPEHSDAHTPHHHSHTSLSTEEVKKVARRLSVEENSSERAGAVGRNKADNAKIGASKAIRILEKMEDRCWCMELDGRHRGFLGVQTDSVYGTAVVMPQIARSCDWPGTLISVVLRSYFFCMVNFSLQAFLLLMIGEEQHFWYPFAGQMHLCDFGASMQDCPDAPNCVGPAGTKLSYPRLYGYDIWSTRTFLKQSLEAVFPTQRATISGNVDPGEYGLENFYCRLACVFLFVLAIVDDLEDAVTLAKTLAFTANADESWIDLDVPEHASKEDVKEMDSKEELDFVSFRVAGMPLYWKLANVCFILLPKSVLWFGLARSGVHYLMETAGIMDVVINSMALTFVLQVDEILFQRLSSAFAKEIMSRLESKELFNMDQEDAETDAEALSLYNDTELSKGWLSIIARSFPVRLFIIISLQGVFLLDYYSSNCERLADGSWVSKAMHLPASMGFHPLNVLTLMFGLEGEMEEEPFWTMPS
mmetsp:Transcript_40303/g.93415  ORF Transcript_40303/g.93415 Transcript_40303/m.93415 type:complete len:484 (+) Transcript_40303:33-1484(+)